MKNPDSDLPELDIVTEYGVVTRLPTSFPIFDAELDEHLDPDLFQQGFVDAAADPARFPRRGRDNWRRRRSRVRRTPTTRNRATHAAIAPPSTDTSGTPESKRRKGSRKRRPEGRTCRNRTAAPATDLVR